MARKRQPKANDGQRVDVSALEAMGFYFTDRDEISHSSYVPPGGTERTITIAGRLDACRQFMERRREIAAMGKREHEKCAFYVMGRHEQGDVIDYGGTSAETLSDLQGNTDLTLFHASMEKVKASDLSHRLQTSMAGFSPRRKRARSAFDGDWEYDRRFDIEPYSTTLRAPQAVRSIEIRAHFAFHGSRAAQEISDYGALCWAISELIESQGIQTHVKYLKYNNHVSLTPSGNEPTKQMGTKVEIELKKPGEYIAPALLASAFTARFYRRFVWQLIAASVDAHGGNPYPGVGSPYAHSKPIEYLDGVLHLSPEARGAGYTADLEREILKAIGANQQAA